MHASGGKAAADFVPEQRRNFVADDAIEDAASLLRVHQMLVNLRGLLESGFDGFLRDFVEHHAINFGRSAVRGRLFLLGLGGGFGFVLVLFRAGVLSFLSFGDQRGVLFGFAQDFSEVRADGFAFAVRVTRQIDGFGAAGGFLQVVDDFELAGNDLVGWLKDVVGGDDDRLYGLGFRGFRAGFALGLALLLFLAVLFTGQKDADGLLGQVHHVAVGGLDRVVAAQVFVDSLRLSGRFDDYE